MTLAVITPIYQTPTSYVLECAQSLVAAGEIANADSFCDWVVVLDGDQRDLARQLDPVCRGTAVRCSVVRLPGNFGLSYARNIGLAHTQAEFVTWLDADDRVEPAEFVAFIADATQTLTSDPRVLLALSDSFDCNADLSVRVLRRKDWLVALHRKHHGTLDDPLLWVDFVYPAQLLRRRDVLEVGGFREGVIGEDVDFVLRFRAAFPERHIRHIARPAYHYRFNPNGIVETNLSALRALNVETYSRVQAEASGEVAPLRWVRAKLCPECVSPHLVPTTAVERAGVHNCYVGDELSPLQQDVVYDCGRRLQYSAPARR